MSSQAVVAVYSIRNQITQRVYVGSSKNATGRWDSHRRLLVSGDHYNPELQSDWKALGPDAFCFDLLESVPEEELGIAENRWIDRFKDRLYNVRPAYRLAEPGWKSQPCPAEYMTMRQAQEALGVSNYTIWRMVKEGRLATYTTELDRRKKLVRRADVKALMKIVPKESK